MASPRDLTTRHLPPKFQRIQEKLQRARAERACHPVAEGRRHSGRGYLAGNLKVHSSQDAPGDADESHGQFIEEYPALKEAAPATQVGGFGDGYYAVYQGSLYYFTATGWQLADSVWRSASTESLTGTPIGLNTEASGVDAVESESDANSNSTVDEGTRSDMDLHSASESDEESMTVDEFLSQAIDAARALWHDGRIPVYVDDGVTAFGSTEEDSATYECIPCDDDDSVSDCGVKNSTQFDDDDSDADCISLAMEYSFQGAADSQDDGMDDNDTDSGDDSMDGSDSEDDTMDGSIPEHDNTMDDSDPSEDGTTMHYSECDSEDDAEGDPDSDFEEEPMDDLAFESTSEDGTEGDLQNATDETARRTESDALVLESPRDADSELGWDRERTSQELTLKVPNATGTDAHPHGLVEASAPLSPNGTTGGWPRPTKGQLRLMLPAHHS